ncbi:MAG TPA: VWA domain-containing protein [Roseiflexaceae bacterium]|nr:VWA domain-containing protein [Roseiflexaceae bacterium]
MKKTSAKIAARLLALACICALLSGNATPRALGFSNIACCDGPIHEIITALALPFLNPITILDIADEHVQIDTVHAFDQEYHFDGCHFSDSIGKINSLYDTALTEIPGEADDVADTFGQLLHVIQDFYSHSNWIELGLNDIVEKGEGKWSSFAPYQPHPMFGDTIFLERDNSDFLLHREGAFVTATNGGTAFRGVITGIFGDGDVCPTDPDIRMPHDDEDGQIGLNKDDNDRDPLKHMKAVMLAERQTRQEWCRLAGLTEQRYPVESNALPEGGVKWLFDLWVDDPEGARAICPKDVALIIDATGSMNDNDPDRRRIEAAKLFIDTAPVGYRITVVSFASTATVVAPLREIKTEADRNTLKQAVESINNAGDTNINAALETGYQALLPSGKAFNIAILLTDGEHNVGDYNPENHQRYTRNDWPVYTVGLGAGTDTALLSSIANDTGGSFIALQSSLQLQELYHRIAQGLNGEQTSYQQTFLMAQGDSRQVTVNIGESRPSASFLVTWPGSDVDLSVSAPDGQTLSRQNSSTSTYFASGRTYELFNVLNPQPGTWTVNIAAVSMPTGAEPVTLNVAASGQFRTVLLPQVQKADPCQPANGESNTIADALTACFNKPNNGSVSTSGDRYDVYKITLPTNNTTRIVLTGTGGDADLYLYPPTATAIDGRYLARSYLPGTNEQISYQPGQTAMHYVVIHAYARSTNYTLTISFAPQTLTDTPAQIDQLCSDSVTNPALGPTQSEIGTEKPAICR